MRMFNLDGSEGKMCGNAIRCVGKYLYDNKIVDSREMTIETLSGIKHLTLFVENGKTSYATVDMGKAVLKPSEIPVLLDGENVVNRAQEIDGKTYHITCVSMGNPHCVVFVDDLDQLDIAKVGAAFENAPIFPERVNTEFVSVYDKTTVKMRVWERGSGETLACGTGACAAAVACVLNGCCPKNENITIKLRGGDLTVKYMNDDTVYLTGKAEKVFGGEVEI